MNRRRIGNRSAVDRTFDGFLDEFLLFDASIVANDITIFIARDFFDDSNAFEFNTNPICYLSMDNPHLGIRETARQVVT